MKTYTEAELISFGKFLLGIERVTKFFDKKESFYEVYDADLENWKFKMKWDTPIFKPEKGSTTWVNLEEKQEEIKNNKN